MSGARSSRPSYSASVWPPGTPNTCRTPCSASRAASCPPPWSATCDPQQPGGIATQHQVGTGAEAERPHLLHRMVGAHVERPVGAEQHLPGPGVPDQVGQQVLIVGDSVVVEPPQRLVLPGRGAGPGFGPD